MPAEPCILFEDQHLAVIDKPAGLLSQPDISGEPSLVEWLRRHFGRYYVGLIHRLDRNVSGVMVVAKRTKAARRLSEALIEGKLRRMYLAWVEGEIQGIEVWRHWLLKDEKKNETRVITEKKSGAKWAELAVTPLVSGNFNGRCITQVEFDLETGRSHQIRVQSAAMSHPLLGDPKYGPSKKTGPVEISRPALHSWKIEFPHPSGGEVMKWICEPPADFKKIGDRLQKSRG